MEGVYSLIQNEVINIILTLRKTSNNSLPNDLLSKILNLTLADSPYLDGCKLAYSENHANKTLGELEVSMMDCFIASTGFTREEIAGFDMEYQGRMISSEYYDSDEISDHYYGMSDGDYDYDYGDPYYDTD
ncbi:TPA_asm: P4 [Euphorbia alphacytorhabdovirus 1]|nr:TPA_asm: P4 [Euphorbia alphacytorhabdovirus 1]